MPKYKTLTLREKVSLIEEAEKSTCTKTQLAERHKMPLSTLSTILKNKEKLLEAYGKTHSSKRSRIRFPTYPDVEVALMKWLQRANAAHLPVNGTILREKADDLALRLGHEGFKCSNGWFARFKERNNLTYLTVCGESGSADTNVVDDWQMRTLAPLLQEFGEDDVYNLDEAALFYKMLPTKTFAAKDTTVSGRKQPKERISILFGANMSGNDKLPLLVIGRAGKPRCFKNARLPPRDVVMYRHNKKAWMTAAIFEEYVRFLDRKFASKGRKVLFVIDNCPAHGDIRNLEAVKIVFLPANTTAISQPMDQGVILQTRKIYRHHLLKRVLLCYDSGKQYHIDLLGAICLIAFAWKELESKVIRRCFEHAGFRKQGGEDLDEDCSSSGLDDEGDSMCARITDSGDGEGLGFVEYSSVEAGVQTSYADVHEDVVDTGLDGDDGDDNEPARAPALASVVDAVNTFRSFVECSGGDSEMLSIVSRFENMALGAANYRNKQSNITDYFK